MSYQVLEETTNFLSNKHKLLIDGNWLDSSDGKSFDVFNPANKNKIAEVCFASSQDVDKAVSSARNSFDRGVWSGMTPLDRTKILWKWADLLESKLRCWIMACLFLLPRLSYSTVLIGYVILQE
jgi:acyl-CoA reductase-like NAD-dependent aldehyde dehydrogenase